MLCRSCAAPISELARFCGHCGRKVDREPLSAAQEELTGPLGFNVEDDGFELRMTFRWFTPPVILLVLFCVMWDGFLLARYAGAFPFEGKLWSTPVMWWIHLAAGIGMTVYATCQVVNRTTIRVRSGMLSIRHWPIWWPWSQRFRTDDIQQLYCKQRSQRTRNGGSRLSYGLYAMVDRGKSRKVLGGLREPRQVQFIEQAIERHLRIPDRPMAGELRRQP